MKIKRAPLTIILTLGVLTAIGSISIDIYLPAFEVMANYFKVPIAHMERTVTFFLFGMACGQLFIGPISDVWGRKIPLQLGLLVYVISSICCTLTGSFSLFLILRFIQGLAGSACQVISRALVHDLYQGNQAMQMFSVLQIIMGISPIISPVIGGLLAEDSVWKYLFLMMAIASGSGLLGSLTVLSASKEAVKKNVLDLKTLIKGYGYCIKHPAFVKYAITRSIANSAAFSFVTASPFVFIQLFGLTKKQYGFVFSLLAAGMVLVGILNTRLIKYYSTSTIIKFAIAFQIGSGVLMILVLYFKLSFIVLLLLIFAFLSMLGLILPNATYLYIGALPSLRGSASALVGTTSYLSAFLITSLLGLLNNHTAYPMVLTMCSCAVIAYLCLLYNGSKV